MLTESIQIAEQHKIFRIRSMGGEEYYKEDLWDQWEWWWFIKFGKSRKGEILSHVQVEHNMYSHLA